jgi:hypothetical protein
MREASIAGMPPLSFTLATAQSRKDIAFPRVRTRDTLEI